MKKQIIELLQKVLEGILKTVGSGTITATAGLGNCKMDVDVKEATFETTMCMEYVRMQINNHSAAFMMGVLENKGEPIVVTVVKDEKGNISIVGEHPEDKVVNAILSISENSDN